MQLLGIDIDILIEDTVFCTVLVIIQKEADLVKAVLYMIAILVFHCCYSGIKSLKSY